MAFEACSHGEVRNLADNIHRFDQSMAVCAFDSTIYRRAMIEIRVVGHLVDTLPRKGDTLLVVFRQFDDFRFVLAGDCVAIHADGNGWD